MTTVLRLETMAYNRLLNVVQKDLCRLEAALQGHIVMSVEVEAAFEEVQKGKLPSTWETYSYPTESMLNDYLEVTKKSSRLAKKISTKYALCEFRYGYFVDTFAGSIASIYIPELLG